MHNGFRDARDVEGFSMLAQYGASHSWKDIIKLIVTISGLRKETSRADAPNSCLIGTQVGYTHKSVDT
jgi:hypothetical protein